MTKPAAKPSKAHKPTLSYWPQGPAAIALDSIVNLFRNHETQPINLGLHGKKFMCVFPDGQLYFESKLDLDTDGSRYYQQDPSGQRETGTKMANGRSLDADSINYFVLPGNFSVQHNIQKGDIAVVLYGSKVAYACFGDSGPETKLGEGSIALHRALGHETIHHHHAADGGQLMNEGIAAGVITIVFPGSGNGFGRENSESEAVGKPLFTQLKRKAAILGDFPAARPGELRFG